MANNKLNRIKEGYKLLSLLEHKELKDCRMAGDSAVLYFKNGDVFLIKGYVDEVMANKDVNYILEAFEKERGQKNDISSI